MKQFETREVIQGLAAHIINILWYLVENMEALDIYAVQSFCLSKLNIDGKLYQQILNAQENTDYVKDFSFECQNPVNAFVAIERFEVVWVMYFSNV